LDQGITGKQVAKMLEPVLQKRGLPERIFLYYSPEIVSKAMDKWAREHEVALDFCRTGKPTEQHRDRKLQRPLSL